MQEIKVLIGFKKNVQEDLQIENELSTELKALGYEPKFIRKTNKKDVADYLRKNRDCHHAILTEVIGENAFKLSTFSAAELMQLVDDMEINIVLVLSEKRKKDLNFLFNLYTVGITSAFFEKGKIGPTYQEVAGYLIHPRSRRDARDYYGIHVNNLELRTITYEMFAGLFAKLMDEESGYTCMNRLLHIAEEVNPYQMADFLHKLPENVIMPLTEYAEFALLVEEIEKNGVKVKYFKKPKHFKYMEDDYRFSEEPEKADLTDKPESRKEKMPLSKLFQKKQRKENESPDLEVDEMQKNEEQSVVQTVDENMEDLMLF